MLHCELHCSPLTVTEMAQTNNFLVHVDRKTNKLIITLKGVIRREDVDAIYTDIRFGVSDLEPGFDVITDLRQGRFAYISGTRTFYNIAEFLKSKGVRRVIRISGKPGILQKQMQRVIKKVTDYDPMYVESMEEAEQILSRTDE